LVLATFLFITYNFPKAFLWAFNIQERVLKNETGPVILVADDEPVYQKIFSLILEKLGYNFVLADNGEDALEKAKTTEPALIFFDILMPKMNGFEAAENLRRCGFKKPIIAITATQTPEDEENCKKSGINDMLIKPIKSLEIQKILEKWITVETEPYPEQSEHNSVYVSGPAAFSAKEMLNAFMNEEKAVLPLLSRFIERTSRQLENFPVLVASGGWADARREAHTIKGAAGTMGGKDLGKTAGVLEQACINTSIKEVETAFTRVLEAFEKYKTEAEEYIFRKKSQ